MFEKWYYKIAFKEKRQFFNENSDHNIDPKKGLEEWLKGY
jgi:hypothetical protein